MSIIPNVGGDKIKRIIEYGMSVSDFLNTIVKQFIWPKPTMSEELPEYTRSHLALRNGQDKPEIWVALDGIIYDVTRSRMWRAGKHYEHWAGQDLTDELRDAPHNANVFDKFKAVGKLKQG